MRKTYVTKVPDEKGAFLAVSRLVDSCGGRMIRVNYNRAMDIHTLFMEVCATPEQHRALGEALRAGGYLKDAENDSRILMLVLTIPDQPGVLSGALQVLDRFQTNISYISTQENPDRGECLMKMGILIRDTEDIPVLEQELLKVCETRVLDYEVTDRLLDGTVFYETFTKEMKELLHLSAHDAGCVLIRSNKLMQILDEQDKSPLQTFDYIRRFAKFVQDHKGEGFDIRVSSRELAEGLKLTVMEPPCGSNTYVLEYQNELLFVDGGYSCFLEEMKALILQRYPDFHSRHTCALLTHVDMDHTGLMSLFDTVYMSRHSRDDLLLEAAGEAGFREQNPKHAPYFGLSEIITRYTPPETAACQVVGDRSGDELLCPIGQVSFGPWTFDILEGPGGHVKGEIVAVCRELRFLFSGDIYVNVKGISPEQKEFNRLAPFLLTGVDEDPALARKTRDALTAAFPGFLFCPGHGPVMQMP